MPVDVVRDRAVGVLLRVFEEGAYLNIALDKTLRRRKVSERGRRFMTQLVYGTVRRKRLADHVLKKRVKQPLDELPRPILAILRMGVFQALFCRQVTFPAMVHTSVELAKRRGHAGTARLVNAVLRHVPTELDAVKLPKREKDAARYLGVRHSMPDWLVGRWIEEYGEERTEALCAACDMEAPTVVRTNTLKITRDDLVAALAKAGCVAEHRTPIPEELTLLTGLPPARSKQFEEGDFLIQDAASMLPAHLLEPKPGERVLDLCAAPGGKTTHLAQLADGEAFVVANDVHARKLWLVANNMDRLEMPGIAGVCGDGVHAPFLPLFDRVLVDAPCTGLGTLRRHPELKWRVTAEQAESLARLQVDLLRSAVRLCKNGGLVVYSVCTFTREETGDVVRAVLDAENVEPEDGPEWLNQWKTKPGEYRILPESGGLDGFFLTRLRKGS
ncbi:MAG: 16S rRNA (cytosine(967)-C(5))-methyltransferase RsmB [Nitrospiraceae bacterium]|nr:16S rRNA (cytosine(967)-C(5))-methyltransferase RsmB [Nitrospiraceae bacterium]